MIEEQSRTIEKTGHFLHYWLVLWGFVIRMFLPLADVSQGGKLIEAGLEACTQTDTENYPFLDWFLERELNMPHHIELNPFSVEPQFLLF